MPEGPARDPKVETAAILVTAEWICLSASGIAATLKLAGECRLSWFWVTSPLWGLAIVAGSFLAALKLTEWLMDRLD